MALKVDAATKWSKRVTGQTESIGTAGGFRDGGGGGDGGGASQTSLKRGGQRRSKESARARARIIGRWPAGGVACTARSPPSGPPLPTRKGLPPTPSTPEPNSARATATSRPLIRQHTPHRIDQQHAFLNERPPVHRRLRAAGRCAQSSALSRRPSGSFETKQTSRS